MATLFEMGRTFQRDGAGYAQPMRLGGLAFGPALPEQWGLPTHDADFHDIKGDLETLVAPAVLTTGTELIVGGQNRPNI